MKIEPFKMEVTPEQSRQVQEIIFRNGGSWRSGLDTVQYEDSPFLYFKDSTLTADGEHYRGLFEDRISPLITFAEFMARYGGAQTTQLDFRARYGGAETTQFDIMRKIVTIAEEAHENGETGLCSVILDALADYISTNRPE